VQFWHMSRSLCKVQILAVRWVNHSTTYPSCLRNKSTTSRSTGLERSLFGWL